MEHITFINPHKNNIFLINNKKFLLKEIENNSHLTNQNNLNQIDFFVKPLFNKYVEYLGNFGIDLNFQDFQTELDSLPGIYSINNQGTILVILNIINETNEIIDLKDTIPVGIVALKDLKNQISEMKRLFVLDEFRGFGLGKILMDHIIFLAKKYEFKKIRWDTLKKLKDAGKLYDKYNHKSIESYNYNPHDDVLYYELDL